MTEYRANRRHWQGLLRLPAIAVLILTAVSVPASARAQKPPSDSSEPDSTADALLQEADEPTFDLESFYDELEGAIRTVGLNVRSRMALDPHAWDERGYAERTYLGGPEATQTRAQARMGRVLGGIAIQKDAWEERYTDDWAGYLETDEPIGNANLQLRKAVIGNFRLSFGSGLIFGSGLTSVALRSSPARDPSSPFGLRHSLSPHALTPLFGGAVTATLGSTSITPFYSHTSIDARIDSLGIRTLYSYHHRTAGEASYRGTVTLNVSGAHLALQDSSIGEFGATFAQSAYGLPLHTGSSKLPQGARLSQFGADAAVPIKHVARLSGEFAGSSAEGSTGKAYIAALSLMPVEQTRVLASYHHQDTGYFAPSGSIIGESEGDLTNSEGYWIGVESALTEKLRTSCGIAYSREADAISRSNGEYKADGFLEVGWVPDATLEATLRYRDRRSTNSSSAGLDNKIQHNARVLGRWSLSESFALDVRAEGTTLTHSISPEVPVGGMIQFTAVQRTESSSLRATIARFSSDNYDARVYSYIPEVAGIGSILLLYGRGYYAGLSTKFNLSRSLSVEAFGGAYLYDHGRTIGSGLTERTGATDMTTMVQLSFRK